MSLKNNWLFEEARKIKFSTRLTLIYAILFSLLLVAINIFTLSGFYFVLYHQAEVEIDISTKRTMQNIEKLAINSFSEIGRNDKYGAEAEDDDRKGLLPGVVLRVFDTDSNMLYDSNPSYFKMERLENNVMGEPPIWANTDIFSVIQFRNMVIYRRDVPVVYDGKEYNMVFFKTVTAENQALETIKQILLGADVLGVLLSLLIGFFVVKQSLKPVRDLNETAKNIQVDDLSSRIEVSPAGDELTELATTFNTMLDRLEAGFKAQQKFVSDASHELRTPVTVIKGYADMLDRWGSKDEAVLKESIEAIKSEAEDMQALIEKLLFLARADQKRQILKKNPIDMGVILEDVAKKMKIAAEKHEVTLEGHPEGLVFADHVTMRQMLRIFLENSMKYTPAGGHIVIAGRLDMEYNRYIVELSDDGIGIAKDDQPKIFQRFYRVDSSRTREAGTPGGTGLGLSIAQWIAESHNIEIDLESDLGQGTKFILRIPLYEGNNAESGEEKVVDI